MYMYNLHQTTDSIFIKFSTGFVSLKIFEVENFVYTILIKSTPQVNKIRVFCLKRRNIIKIISKLRKMQFTLLEFKLLICRKLPF